MFAIGVGHYVFENYQLDHIRFLASSSGCFAAVPLACGLDPYKWCENDWGKCISHFNNRGLMLSRLGLECILDSKHFYYQLWDEYLPEDAHIRCTNRLFISVTLFPSLKNKVVSQFDSREMLIWTIVASICLPIAFMRDFPVNVPGVGNCIDGGFSNDSPCLDSYTITSSALHTEADITPTSVQEHNLEDDTYFANPLTFLDILITPKYERVWEVGAVGMAAAANCPDFNRREWQRQLKNKLPEVELCMTCNRTL